MSNTQQTLAQLVRAKYPDAYSDMNDRDLEKAVLAKHPEYSDLPRTTGFGPGLPAPSKIPPGMTGHPEEGFQAEDIPKNAKAAAEVLGSTVGADAVPLVRGLFGLLLRATGAGVGAGAANVGAQAVTTGQVNPQEALQTAGGFAAGEAAAGGFQAFGETRAALKDLFFKPNTQLTDLGKAIVHPTELPEMLVRKALGVESPAGKPESVPITKSPNYDPAAYKAGAAARTTQPAETPAQPFIPGATPTTPAATAKFIDLKLPTAEGAPPPRDIQFVDKFGAQSTGKIVEPGSARPAYKVTYQSVTQKDLHGMVMKGDGEAIREWMRRGLPLSDGVKFLVEDAKPRPWRNLNQ